jgi:glycosyltransferase involved in cell wall biosynthesis
MQSPLITIIIPAFNAAVCIREALNSLLQQSFTAFEVLVVDGVSRDNTLAIVQELAERDNRVRFISEKDAGIYDAMNKGIGLAAGEWLYFLGADDALYNEQVLEKVAPVLQQTNALLVYGWAIKTIGTTGRLPTINCYGRIFRTRPFSITGKCLSWQAAITSSIKVMQTGHLTYIVLIHRVLPRSIRMCWLLISP